MTSSKELWPSQIHLHLWACLCPKGASGLPLPLSQAWQPMSPRLWLQTLWFPSPREVHQSRDPSLSIPQSKEVAIPAGMEPLWINMGNTKWFYCCWVKGCPGGPSISHAAICSHMCQAHLGTKLSCPFCPRTFLTLMPSDVIASGYIPLGLQTPFKECSCSYVVTKIAIFRSARAYKRSHSVRSSLIESYIEVMSFCYYHFFDKVILFNKSWWHSLHQYYAPGFPHYCISYCVYYTVLPCRMPLGLYCPDIHRVSMRSWLFGL